MLTLKQVEQVCLRGQSELQCRFLAESDDGVNCYCVKKTVFKDQINEEVDLFIESQKRIGADPNDKGIPIGDNCQGYLYLKHKSQGVDVI